MVCLCVCVRVCKCAAVRPPPVATAQRCGAYKVPFMINERTKLQLVHGHVHMSTQRAKTMQAWQAAPAKNICKWIILLSVFECGPSAIYS